MGSKKGIRDGADRSSKEGKGLSIVQHTSDADDLWEEKAPPRVCSENINRENNRRQDRSGSGHNVEEANGSKVNNYLQKCMERETEHTSTKQGFIDLGSKGRDGNLLNVEDEQKEEGACHGGRKTYFTGR